MSYKVIGTITNKNKNNHNHLPSNLKSLFKSVIGFVFGFSPNSGFGFGFSANIGFVFKKRSLISTNISASSTLKLYHIIIIIHEDRSSMWISFWPKNCIKYNALFLYSVAGLLLLWDTNQDKDWVFLPSPTISLCNFYCLVALFLSEVVLMYIISIFITVGTFISIFLSISPKNCVSSLQGSVM